MILCKNCLTLAICRNINMKFFDRLNKCHFLLDFILREVEKRYDQSIEKIYNNELYNNEYLDNEDNDPNKCHIYNSMMLLDEELSRVLKTPKNTSLDWEIHHWLGQTFDVFFQEMAKMLFDYKQFKKSKTEKFVIDFES